MEKLKEAYEEILNVLNKHRDICIYDVQELEYLAKNHLFGNELKEKFGLKLDPKDIRSSDYVRIDGHRAIGWWGEKYRRTISWPDDSRQPQDELLLVISFSTGAYIFGDDYPEELFKEFFQEIKNFKPDYCDSVNHNIYFSINNASTIFNEFGNILNKYRQKNIAESNERRIKKLKSEIEQLDLKK